jgi:hypothetical protein
LVWGHRKHDDEKEVRGWLEYINAIGRWARSQGIRAIVAILEIAKLLCDA